MGFDTLSLGHATINTGHQGDSSVAGVTHPVYNKMWSEWFKFRLTFRGGRDFVEEYLERFSKREDFDEYHRRKQITYAPSHAKSAVVDIRNSIFERMRDIVRCGGPESYQRAIVGLDKGVDLDGSTMNGYVGRILLKELLVMGKVGVYVDKFPQQPGASLVETQGNRPYLYHYPAEDIRSWRKDKFNNLNVLLLRDRIHIHDEVTGLVIGFSTKFRLLTRVIEAESEKIFVRVQFFDHIGQAIPEEETILDLPVIPFVHFGISESLLTDVADYQIALLNLESADMSYALKSNYPLYVEQFDPAADFTGGLFTRPPGGPDAPVSDHFIGEIHGGSALHGASTGHGATPADGKALPAQVGRDHTIEMGASSGRRYPRGLNEPNFINPSPDPIRVSMEKQEGIKADIRRLVNLTAETVTSRSIKPEATNDASLQAGLAAIGLELEWGERRIAAIWSAYEEHNPEDIRIQYPQTYSLKTDIERREEATELGKIGPTIPSQTFKKTVAKRQATIIIGHLVPNKDLKQIHDEIDKAEVVTTDPDVIKQDFETGLVSLETASQARGYKKGEVAQAKKDHAERLARIAAAQSSVPTDVVDGRPASRGVPDADPDPSRSPADEKEESRDNTSQGDVKDRTRGDGQ